MMSTNVIRFPAERRNPTMSTLDDLISDCYMFADIDMIAEDLDHELPTEADVAAMERSIYDDLSRALLPRDRKMRMLQLRTMIQPRINAAIAVCREVERLTNEETRCAHLAREAAARGAGEGFFQRMRADARADRAGVELRAYEIWLEARSAERASRLLAEGKPWAPENFAEAREWFESFVMAMPAG